MNKLTGVLLFILPLTLTMVDLRYSGALVSAVATFAAIQEGYDLVVDTSTKSAAENDLLIANIFPITGSSKKN